MIGSKKAALLVGSIAVVWSVTAAVRAQEARTFPHVEYRATDVARETISYECAGSTVELVMESSASGARITRYSNGSGSATPGQLAQWNDWLHGVGVIVNHDFSCQADDHQRISITGYAADSLTTREVTVWWHGTETGMIGRYDIGRHGVRTRLSTSQ